MNELQEHLENYLQKLQIMEHFIALSLRRDKICPEVKNLLVETEGVRKIMEQSQKLLMEELKKADLEYKKQMRCIKEKQSVILDHVLKEKRRKIEEAKSESKQMIELLGAATPQTVNKNCSKSLASSFAQMNIFQGTITPKMTIYDYKESPLVKKVRIKPLPISFLDFDHIITQKKFSEIPPYMRGRETLDKLNEFLTTVIIPCFNDKYQLLHRSRTTLRHPEDLKLWNVYHEQKILLPDQHFITPGDISRHINKMIDRSSQNRITMLRHISVLREQRIGQTTCYIWLPKQFSMG